MNGLTVLGLVFVTMYAAFQPSWRMFAVYLVLLIPLCCVVMAVIA